MMEPIERRTGMSPPDPPSESVETDEPGGESDGVGGTPLGRGWGLPFVARWSEDKSEEATPDLTPPGQVSGPVGPFAPACQPDGMAAEAPRAQEPPCQAPVAPSSSSLNPSSFSS